MIEFVCEWCQTDTLTEALAQVTATKEIGATHAKWQIFNPSKLAGPDATRYWHESLGGSGSQRDLFAEFGCLSGSEWREVAHTCLDMGVEFMATPFDFEAVELLENIGVSAFKLASGDITYRPLIEKVARTKRRVYLSTGAAQQYEIANALSWLRGCEVIPMACDLVYPCPAEQASLAAQIPALRRYCAEHIQDPTLGYSDHTREIITGAVAVTLGARVLEKHITLTPERGRPDDRMALTVEQAKTYRQLADDALALTSKVDGDPQHAARVGARRSAHASRDLAVGDTLKTEDVAWLRPCPAGSISPQIHLAGYTVKHPVKAGERITTNDLA